MSHGKRGVLAVAVVVLRNADCRRVGVQPCTKRGQRKLACYAEPNQGHDRRELPFGLHPFAVVVGGLAYLFLEEFDKL